MKNQRIILLCVLMLFVLLCLAACGECTHTYGEWRTVTEATCTATGERERVCTACGGTEREPIDMIAHTPAVDDAKAPTESETGLTEGSHCSMCQKVIVAQESIPTLTVGTNVQSDRLQISGNTISGTVSAGTSDISFDSYLQLDGAASYTVATDADFENVVEGKAPALVKGDNLFYIKVVFYGFEKIYEVTIRRLPTYTVVFDAGNGTSTTSAPVEEGSPVAAPAIAPERQGYTFGGWNHDFSSAITGEITIKAIWIPRNDIAYRVEFYLETLSGGYDINNGMTQNKIGTTDETVYAVFDDIANYVPAELQFGGVVLPDGSLVIKVYLNLVSYQVTIDPDGAALTSGTLTQKIKHGGTIALPVLTKPGYDFLGFENLPQTVTESITVVAKWQARTDTPYRVEYYFENLQGNYVIDATKTQNKTGETDSTVYAVIDDFSHYYCTEITVSGVVTGDGQLVLQVKYNRERFDVTIDAAGGTLAAGTLYQQVPYGGTVILPELVRAGYDFLGFDGIPDTVTEAVSATALWRARSDTPYRVEHLFEALSGEFVIDKTRTENKVGTTGEIVFANALTVDYFTANEAEVSGTVLGDGTLVLQVYYTRVSHTVTVDMNGGMLISGSLSTEIKHGGAFVLPQLKKNGYTLVGFEGISDIVTQDVTIVAKWEMARYGITYNMGDIEGEINNPESFTVEDTIVLQAPDASLNPGFVFDGWYYNGVRVTVISGNYAEDLVLEARWESIFIVSDDGTTIEGLTDAAKATMSELIIPEKLNGVTITKIGYGTFEDNVVLTRVEIPDTVTEIGSHAFAYCKNLKEVTVGTGVTLIRSYAFTFCESLEVVHIKDIARWCAIEFGDQSGGVVVANPLHYAHYFTLNGEPVYQLEIPEGVTEIKSYAFTTCENLVSVKLPASMQTINSGAFNECIKIAEVYNDSSLDIVAGVWGEHGNVASNAHNVIKSTEVHNLEMTEEGLVFYRDESTCLLVSYVGKGVSVVLPDLYQGTAYSIGQSAFRYHQAVESIVVPATVTDVSYYAFANTPKLASVVINAPLVTLKNHLFYYATALKTFTVPGTVTGFEGNVFTYCASLTDLYFTSPSMSFSNENFYGCKSLKNIHIDDAKKWAAYSSAHLSDAIFNYAENLYENGVLVESVTITDTGVKAYAFAYYDKLKTVVIGTGVNSIYTSAFYDCDGLVSVEIGADTTSLGASAFYDCDALRTVSIAYAMSEISKQAFYSCDNLVSVKLAAGGSYRKICESAFAYCRKLWTFSIPSGVAFIDKNAFASCSALSFLYIPSSVQTINSGAFSGCYSLFEVANQSGTSSIKNTTVGSTANGYFLRYAKTVQKNGSTPQYVDQSGDFVFYKNGSDYYLLAYTGTDANVTLPTGNYVINKYFMYANKTVTRLVISEGPTEIGSYVFANCENLTSVTIPASITKIDHWYAFDECTKIREVYNLSGKTCAAFSGANVVKHTSTDEASVILDDIKDYLFMKRDGEYYLVNYVGTASELHLPESYHGNAYHVDNYAFKGNVNLKVLYVPEGVKSILSGAFENCIALERVKLAEGIVSISGFKGCTALKSIVLPQSLTEIGSQAFYGCNLLEEIVIPNGVTVIGSSAFYDCKSLETITVGSGVTSIGSDAFNNCTALTYLNIGNVNKWAEITFGNAYSNPMYYTKSAYVDGRLLTTLVISAEVKVIKGYAFYNCTSLRAVHLPEGVTHINCYAFQKCTMLQYIVIGSGMEYIYSYAFDGCSNLKTLYTYATSSGEFATNIQTGNSYLSNWYVGGCAVWYYAEAAASGYWHMVNGVPTVWMVE